MGLLLRWGGGVGGRVSGLFPLESFRDCPVVLLSDPVWSLYPMYRLLILLPLSPSELPLRLDPGIGRLHSPPISPFGLPLSPLPRARPGRHQSPASRNREKGHSRSPSLASPRFLRPDLRSLDELVETGHLRRWVWRQVRTCSRRAQCDEYEVVELAGRIIRLWLITSIN